LGQYTFTAAAARALDDVARYEGGADEDGLDEAAIPSRGFPRIYCRLPDNIPAGRNPAEAECRRSEEG
jgi:hypothetical protein